MTESLRLRSRLAAVIVASLVVVACGSDPRRAASTEQEVSAAQRSVQRMVLPRGDDAPRWVRDRLWLASAASTVPPGVLAALGWWNGRPDPAKGRAMIAEALALAPDDPVVHRYAGESQLARIALVSEDEQRARARQAAEHFRRAWQADSGSAAPGLGLARALGLLVPDHPEVRPTLEAAHRVQPDETRVTIALARRRLDDGGTAAAATLLDTLERKALPSVDRVEANDLRRRIDHVRSSPAPIAAVCPDGGRRLQLVVPSRDRITLPCVDSAGVIPGPPSEGPNPAKGLCRYDDITTVMSFVAPRVEACFSSLLARTIDEERLMCRFRIGHGGRVDHVRVEVEGALSAIGDCIAEVIRSTPWVPPRGGGHCMVHFPFVFDAE